MLTFSICFVNLSVFFIAKYTSCILIYTAGDSNLIISDADPIDMCAL